MEQEINQTNNEKIKVGSSFINFFTIVVRHRWFLFWLVFIITLLSTSYALLSPKWYKSTVTVFPSEQADLLGGLSGLSSIVKGFSPSSGLSALTGNPQLDKYMAILKSSKIADTVIEKYNYREIYEFEQDDYYEKILEEFQSNLVVEVADEGNLMISFFDKDPKRAAEVANYMVELLNEINTDLNVRDAKANRKFIEKRYDKNVNDIQVLEQQMREFQEEYGVVAVPEQPNYVYIFGKVGEVGFYTFEPGKSFENYLRDAGGITEYGQDDVFLIRAKSREWINLTDNQDTIIEPGDYI